MTLYEIDSRIMALIAQMEAGETETIDGETGEVMDISAELDALGMAREEKLDNVACLCKELAAEIDAITMERRALSARQMVKEARLTSLQTYLKAALTDAEGNTHPFESARAQVRFRRTKTVSIEPWAKLPAQYMRSTVKTEADKIAIRKALEAGIEIAGVQLISGASMTIK